MAIPYFKEVFEHPIAEFSKHLGQASNERIFFSGKYGAGKTTFLKDYFEQVDVKKEYEVYHLFPVNYSICSNEDIFKYIKYDIILAMLERHDEFPEECKGYLKTFPKFLLKNMDKAFAALIAMIPEVGKSILEMYEKLGALKDAYLTYHDLQNQNDGDKLLEYLDTLESKPGSLVDNDIITKIISAKISSNKPKKSILIVDDLDRLDPEHVFRILNVFAAHFDTNVSSRSRNKFGFNQVIIVSDIENIRNIFYHRYGLQADFAGYIDKFYSTDIYHFDNRAAVSKVANSILSSYTVNGDKNTAGKIYLADRWVGAIITHLIEKGELSLRGILNTHGKDFSYHEESVDLLDNHLTDAWRVPLIYKLKYLADLLGGAGRLVTSLKKLSSENISLRHTRLYLGNLLYILNYEFANSNYNQPFLVDYQGKQFFLEAQRDFEYDSDMITRVEMYRVVLSGEKELGKGEPYYGQLREYWDLCIQVVNRLMVLGYLR
ncbi:P-loop NTPase fold protein [Chitinophaga sp. RAB17]|uniref:P-loop NTPase fold protein n=1 Tax=Chitinophaga sp. RAB17 TaxID=3233049 RepID=UPI003F8FD91F